MKDYLKDKVIRVQTISGKLTLHSVTIDANEHLPFAKCVHHHQGVLLTLWVSPTPITFHALYLLPTEGLYWASSVLPQKRPVIPNVSTIFPVADRLQRAIHELTRIPLALNADQRPWLNHGYFPLGILNPSVTHKPTTPRAYPFHTVEGYGVHEIPVGPIHAGIIEPGHFRFSVVGERILKLETRLGYTHKGIHSLLLNQSMEKGVELISRASGDSTVAYAFAFAMACEQAYGETALESVTLYRAILLERERLMNHVGDIGALVGDAALSSLQAQFTMLKEKLLRHNQMYVQHRYLMDTIVPFQVRQPLNSMHLKEMEKEMLFFTRKLAVLRDICDTHYGLQDRLVTTGYLAKATAEKLGVIGLVAKASGLNYDLRNQSYAPYHGLIDIPVTLQTGDAAARMAIRFHECEESIRLLNEFVMRLWQHVNMGKRPSVSKIHYQQVGGRIVETATESLPEHLQEAVTGIGCVEGFRGPITVVVSLTDKRISGCHFHDPSWQNWPALEYAVMDNMVPDFPLINKSFNLSYSGHDS